jgi:hypothetical protein
VTIVYSGAGTILHKILENLIGRIILIYLLQGLDPNPPKTKFDEIHIHKGLPYITGESHLSNWPIVLTKKGNYKCYLETKWGHPFEQTLMSYAYQETVKGKIKPGLLLLTPTEHNRFDHYDAFIKKRKLIFSSSCSIYSKNYKWNFSLRKNATSTLY